MNSKADDKIRAIIIEDELHNSRMLLEMIIKIRPNWRIESVLESVADSVSWLKTHRSPDLILMDIQLSDGICFSIFNQIEIDTTSRIIFTTAYDEYAIRAFKVNSIDYLLKPIKEGELEAAFLKFEQLRAENLPNEQALLVAREQYTKLIDSILHGKKEYRTRFLISGISDYIKLDTDEIAYIYSSHKLTIAVNFSKKECTLDYNLEQLEKELDPARFFRANRKIILNLDAVTKISNELGGKLCVVTSPETNFEIIISRLKAGEFKNWMGK